MSAEPPNAAGRESALLSEIHALRSELEVLRGAGAQGRPGRWVIAFFFGLIALSIGTAFTIWTAARSTARARAERVLVAPSLSRVDRVGRGLVRGVQECLSDAAPAGGAASIRLRVKLAPAGNIGLLQADVSPEDPALVPCVRRVPSALQPPEPAAGSNNDSGTADIELRYDEETIAAGSQSARWSWAIVAPPKPL